MKQTIIVPFWTALSIQAVIIKSSQSGCIACHAKPPGPHDEGCPVSALYSLIRLAEESNGGTSPAPRRSSRRASRRGGARPGAGRKSNRGGARPGAGRKPAAAKKRTPARKATPRKATKATPRKRTASAKPSNGGGNGGAEALIPPAA